MMIVFVNSQARDGDSVCVALSTQHFNAGRYSLVNIKDNRDVSNCYEHTYKHTHTTLHIHTYYTYTYYTRTTLHIHILQG